MAEAAQAFYEEAKARSRKEANEEQIPALVRQEREVNPCAGTKKALVAIRPEFQKAGIEIGCNRLGEQPKRNGLLVERFPCTSLKYRAATAQLPASPPVA